MKVAGFRLYRYELPLAAPLTLKDCVLNRREGLLLELVGEGGVAGWGEASPLPGFSPENLTEALGQLHDMASATLGRELAGDPGGIFVRELDTADTAPSVRFGFELALWNLQAALSERTLPEFVTSRPRATVPVSALISGPPDKALEDARAARAAGYEAVKLKVGGRPVDEDVELVCAVGGVLGDGVALRLDANRAWSVEEAERFCRDTAMQRIEYVEEPLADPSLLPSLVRECGLPVALDESLVRMPPEALEEYRYVRAAVIKPTLIGGLSRTLRLANRARELGITPVVSSAYETGVGTTALVALAAGIGEVPAGLGTYRRLAADVLLPRLELPAPRLDVRAMFAARREIDRSRLIPVR